MILITRRGDGRNNHKRQIFLSFFFWSTKKHKRLSIYMAKVLSYCRFCSPHFYRKNVNSSKLEELLIDYFVLIFFF